MYAPLQVVNLRCRELRDVYHGATADGQQRHSLGCDVGQPSGAALMQSEESPQRAEGAAEPNLRAPVDALDQAAVTLDELAEDDGTQPEGVGGTAVMPPRDEPAHQGAVAVPVDDGGPGGEAGAIQVEGTEGGTSASSPDGAAGCQGGSGDDAHGGVR